MHTATHTSLSFREMRATDWPAVSAIYQQGIDTGIATFQQQVPEWNEWDMAHLQACRLVAEAGAEIQAWAALTPVSGRCVYAGVAEVSIYVAASARRRGTGGLLLRELISRSEASGIWTLQAGIFPENNASLLLHQRAGFRVVGYREKIGKLNGTWRNTVLLERRSLVAGRE